MLTLNSRFINRVFYRLLTTVYLFITNHLKLLNFGFLLNQKQTFSDESIITRDNISLIITNGNSGLAPSGGELPSPNLWDEGYLNVSLPSSSGRSTGVLSRQPFSEFIFLSCYFKTPEFQSLIQDISNERFSILLWHLIRG